MSKLKISFIVFVAMLGHFAYSQATTVTGVVSDEGGTPLPGASVVVSGTTNGTQTDFDGKYTLTNVASNASLSFSYIGFVAQQVALNGRNSIDITLQEDLQALDEVVVVGYGSQSRASVTGAISSVNSEEITALPVSNATEALQGRAAGVTVVNTGAPGTEPSITIRGLGTFGNNSPLFVVDGVIVGNLSGINQNDIESINVLKDASTTAVYGAQGSNGVVLVTTKKGKPGKTELSLNLHSGFQMNTQRYDLLNTNQYLQYADEAFGIVPNTPSSSSGRNTNWQNEIYKTGLIRNYQMAASGGGEKSNFRISGGYFEREGILLETGFERYSFRANSSFDFGKLKVGQNMSVNFNDINPELDAGGRSVLEHAIKSAPYLPIYNPNNLGGFQGPNSAGDGQDAENPVKVLRFGEAQDKSFGLIGNVYAEYEIIEGLTYKSQVGLDYFNFNSNRFLPSYNTDSFGGTHQQTFAAITKNSSSGQTIIFTNSLTYNKTFADLHNFEFLLLTEKFESKGNGVNANSRNAVSNDINELSNEDSNLNSNSFEYNRLGYLGRLNYNFDDKYIAAFSIRRDASSKFGANNRWGWFSSYALGWNIAKENFMADTAFSTFKLRGSLGYSGNDKIANYLYSATLVNNFLYPIGGSAAVGTTAFGLANPDLKWEETKQQNIGLDLGLFDNKFTAALEYYENRSDDLLIRVPTPTSAGINEGSQVRNVGSVETKGFELSLGFNDYEGDFTWSGNLNLSTSKNKALALGGVEQLIGGDFEAQQITRVAEGESLFHFYGLVTDGIYQNQAEVDAVFTADPGQTTVQAGDIRFKDLNNDGTINSDDRAIIGNPLPELTFGLNLDAEYKNFDFNLFFTGLIGRDLYNTNIYDLEGMPRLFNSGVAVLDRWTPSNPSNTVPRAGGAPQNIQLSDRFVEDGSYGRLKNLTIGYTLPGDAFGKDIISKFRIYVSGQNLITITDYSGLDPEVGNGDLFEYGIDRGEYPQPKTYLVGLQVTF
ncbi:TonB-linked outer membrane protein, SusC/RagA family [Pricia antarctica]|uniref:TonB-linked outer membrane protein, SusC/RagA family n=1 Tax=Pricia antarctica TaxID=641691 RepID=A0A1G7HRP0_9FLAO|nr:TonB-dependent receptor [Pricia antarctica]SDF02954.1 TonB-linked outer membrane protein, SusC/RagA family [Pricia antarctica]